MKTCAKTRKIVPLVLALLLLFGGCSAVNRAAVFGTNGNETTRRQDVLTVEFLDVGQANAALLTCGGKSLLIDGGKVKNNQKLIARLKELEVDHLDAVICSHPDEDHCGGLAAVLAKYPAEHVYSSVTEYTTKVFSNVVKYADEQGHPVEVPQTGDSWTLGSASVQVIGPVQTYSDPNNGSLVLRVDYGETSFLFTGDMGITAEDELVESGARLDATVLKVGHHGSSTSSSADFLRAVRPDCALISCGEGNSYGHPEQVVLDRLEAIGAAVYRTDRDGTIRAVCDGKTIEITTERTS